MSLEMNLLNIVILIVLTLLAENGLRKTIQIKSSHATRVYWFYLLPTYILTTIVTVLLLVTSVASDSLELLLSIQKYALGAHVLACLLFIGAVDGAKVINKSLRERY